MFLVCLTFDPQNTRKIPANISNLFIKAVIDTDFKFNVYAYIKT